VSAFYGLEAARIVWNNIPIYPGLGGEFGNDYLVEHARRFFGGDPRGGTVFTLLDVWVLDPAKVAPLNLACWTPVDHDPAPPAVQAFFQASNAVPVAMSEFGRERLEQFDPLYVPHAVDVDAYKPYDRAEVRAQVGVPEDAFLVGMVAANKGRPSRKGFQQVLSAFRQFREDHDDALLYLHTVMNPDVGHGEHLGAMIESLALPPDSVLIADQYRMLFDPWSAAAMARIYSSFDVLVNPSMGEGFGIPVLEAQACGTPTIVTDFSAMVQVAGPGSWRIDGEPFWTHQRAWQLMPSVGSLLGALEDAYCMPTAVKKAQRKQAREHAMQYAAPRVMDEHMLPALERARERFADREPELVAA
jgi:glycosyltransferase involved in cell wall biosynthesis